VEGREHSIHLTPEIGESPIRPCFWGFATCCSIAQTFLEIKKSTKKVPKGNMKEQK